MERLLCTSGPLRGIITMPGDKSISHRALLLGALSKGTTEIQGMLESEDIHATWECLSTLGTNLRRSRNVIKLDGVAGGLFQPTSTQLSCHNSGTTMRLMMGILAGQPMKISLTGDSSLCNRPMNRVADPLRQMGATVWLDNQRTAPLTVQGKRPLLPISYKLPIPSAQVKSALLLAGLFADGETILSGEIHSRDHTERMLPQFGVSIDALSTPSKAPSLRIVGGQALSACSIFVPGDFSSAAFWIAAATLVPASDIQIRNVSLNPTRTGLLSVLFRMGAHIEIEPICTLPEPIGHLRIRSASLKATDIDPSEVPFLIDELPMFAVLASQAEGISHVFGAEELRRKESDRIDTLSAQLRSMGGNIETTPDGFTIQGKTPLHGAAISPNGDHRIAMAFSIAALIAKGETLIRDAACVSVSYPNFYTDLFTLGYTS